MEEYWIVTIVTISIVGLLVVVILGASFCTVISEQNEDKKLCDTLRNRLQAGEAERHERRIALLKSEMGVDAAQVEKFAGIVEELERRLHEKLISIFSENKEQLAQLDSAVEEMINTFCVSATGVMKQSSSTADIHGELSEQKRGGLLNKLTQENDELSEQNKKLTLELDTMRKESERIMSEYISMYSDNEKNTS